MSVKHTITLVQARKKLELDVRLERQEPRDGALSTDLEPITEPYNRLSISMGSWERRGPRSPWREAVFGQSRETVLAFAKRCAPETRAALQRLCELWAQWHLNDLVSGTEAQMAALADMPNGVQSLDWYTRACAHLEEQGLLTDRGYKFGSKWLTRRVPMAVQSEVLVLVEKLGG